MFARKYLEFDSDWLFYPCYYTAEMIMSPTLLSTLALLFVSFTHSANAGWLIQAETLLTARMDPLVSPNGIASVSPIYFFRSATLTILLLLLARS